jgi:hypothetical protein
MFFFSRFGYLVGVFFIVAVFIASGLGIAFHLSGESTSFLVFLFWGPPCVYYGRTLDYPGKFSTFFGLRLEYWGYGVLVFALLDAYLSWDNLARDWLTIFHSAQI